MIEFTIILINLAYATTGVLVALIFMALGYLVFDRLTPFKTSRELASGNLAVGVVVGAIFIGLGLAVGLVVGLGLN
jgi:uncharacterized membrane protein YjfL (UPF0719 family)